PTDPGRLERIMRHASTVPVLAVAFALALALAPAAPLAAAGPELVSAKPFDVKVAGGVVTVDFTLALSEVSTYPVTITAICCTTEEVLFEGTLAEGAYRFSAPLQKISGHGDLKVVLKTRVTNRSEKGNDSFLVYLKWQGKM
ncbi:MAG TPA: hypothetical protein VN317_05145, partial [Candidatus Methanoperedens sp.]|nr:hypothetical protein [Candidatus Methanoperedens sp.]